MPPLRKREALHAGPAKIFKKEFKKLPALLHPTGKLVVQMAADRGLSKTRLCALAGLNYSVLNATLRLIGLSANAFGLLLLTLEKVKPLTQEEEHLIVKALKETPGALTRDEYASIKYDRNGPTTESSYPEPPAQ